MFRLLVQPPDSLLRQNPTCLCPHPSNCSQNRSNKRSRKHCWPMTRCGSSTCIWFWTRIPRHRRPTPPPLPTLSRGQVAIFGHGQEGLRGEGNVNKRPLIGWKGCLIFSCINCSLIEVNLVGGDIATVPPSCLEFKDNAELWYYQPVLWLRLAKYKNTS